ncbi:MAG: hypothetical protein PHR77_09825 [Kiritimatiellae bacterium]|nr:hypothetical protein [Kiritimatiellia bacterium]MDD5522595.1 hypothetical protein [Kiritimatiellia bacterium]
MSKSVGRQERLVLRTAKLFLAVILGVLVVVNSVVWAEEGTEAFFPKTKKVYFPRGTSQLIKPYLSKPTGNTADYRLVIEGPQFLKYVTFEKQMGTPPREVKSVPGETRDGIPYVKHQFVYDVYPSTGFELSICWLDASRATISYQPGIRSGGTFDWRHLSERISPPKGAAYAKPLIIKWQNRGITGTFWVDNVTLHEEGSTQNLLKAGTFEEPEWKSYLIKPEGKGGGKCAKFICTEEKAKDQQALWMDPKLDATPVDPNKKYVVELDLKTENVTVPGEPIAAVLFAVGADVPEGKSTLFTYAITAGKTNSQQTTELVILPPLKNVRPKEARIAPCMYGEMFSEPEVNRAYAENAWRSGVTWTYGSIMNGVVNLLAPRGHRVWLSKPGEPFHAHGEAAADFLKAHPDLNAVNFTGKPKAGFFCPTWLVSPEGEQARRMMDDPLVEMVNRDGYIAVNWDIEQTVITGADGEKADRGFCICPRCLAAFRKEQGISEADKLDKEAILAKYKDAWVMFRCKQNAELAGHARNALKRCSRPVAFSVYSGYQGQKTREWYGVDWKLLAPHLDMAIAGYGGSRQAIRDTLDALGGVPFIGGELYYLGPVPQPGATGWAKNSMNYSPKPEPWRNRLLRQFVDGGCNGVLIWYLPVMDGAVFYHTSEAAEIIATYEDIFRKGKRCDSSFTVNGIKPEHWAAIEHEGKRLLMLLNFNGKPVETTVEQTGLEGEWKAVLHGKPGDLAIDAKKFTLPLDPWGTGVLVFRKAENK